MEQNKINQAIGEMLCREKYKFIPQGLVGEVCREFVEEYEKTDGEHKMETEQKNLPTPLEVSMEIRTIEKAMAEEKEKIKKLVTQRLGIVKSDLAGTDEDVNIHGESEDYKEGFARALDWVLDELN